MGSVHRRHESGGYTMTRRPPRRLAAVADRLDSGDDAQLINHGAQPDEDLVRLYLNDIGKHALLTKDDEARLAQTIEAGREGRIELSAGKTLTAARKRELRRVVKDGDGAAETFVMANLRLVFSIAKKY